MTSENEEELTKQIIGWQGLTLQVPAEWTVGAVSGDHREGYLRVDGRDFPRLEVRWHEAKGSTDLGGTVERYLQGLQRGRQQQAVEIDAQAKFISRRRIGKDQIQPFTWRGEQAGYGVAWLCKKCGRVILAQLLGKTDEADLEQLAVRVLSSIQDHPAHDWVTWSLYDLHTEVPQGFEVTDTELRAGLTQLSFRRESERLVIARWGLAETALRGRSLKVWAGEQLDKQLRPYRPSVEETDFRGHVALHVTGEAITPLGMWFRLVRHLVQKEHADQLAGYIWHCAPTNRIYVVYGMVDVAHKDLVKQVRDRTRCH